MAFTGKKNSELLDLLATTMENLERNRFEVTQARQNYVAVNHWLAEDKVLLTGGDRIDRKIQLGVSNAAQHVRAFEETDIHIADVMSTITANWTHAQTQWSMERREIEMCSGPEQIVDLVKMRRVEANVGLADLIEGRAWLAPASSSDDKNPLGIPYWIVPLADGQAGEGFYGCYDSTIGVTTVGGIVAATGGANTTAPTGGEARWRNWAAGGAGYYTAMDAEAVDTLKKMFMKVNFRSPRIVEDLKDEVYSDYAVDMNTDTLIGYERLAQAQNDQLGRDLAPFAEQTAFRRIPITWVSELDGDTRDPVYLVNHRVWKLYVLRGDYLRESEPMSDLRTHNVFTTFVDLTYQIVCENRRLQGVMRKTA